MRRGAKGAPCCIVSAFATDDPSGRAGAPCRCLEEDTDVRTERTGGRGDLGRYFIHLPVPLPSAAAACPVVRASSLALGCDIHPGLGPIPYDTPCVRTKSKSPVAPPRLPARSARASHLRRGARSSRPP